MQPQLAFVAAKNTVATLELQIRTVLSTAGPRRRAPRTHIKLRRALQQLSQIHACMIAEHSRNDPSASGTALAHSRAVAVHLFPPANRALTNLFDFGKREHTIEERDAGVSMAETARELTKAKVAAAVKTSYFEMGWSRQLSALARRLSDAIPVEKASYAKDDSELAVSQAKVEIEMLQADLDYRQKRQPGFLPDARSLLI